MKVLNLSLRICALKSFQAISGIKVELKTDVSDNCFVSIIIIDPDDGNRATLRNVGF
jgi:hypothetical protein